MPFKACRCPLKLYDVPPTLHVDVCLCVIALPGPSLPRLRFTTREQCTSFSKGLRCDWEYPATHAQGMPLEQTCCTKDDGRFLGARRHPARRRDCQRHQSIQGKCAGRSQTIIREMQHFHFACWRIVSQKCKHVTILLRKHVRVSSALRSSRHHVIAHHSLTNSTYTRVYRYLVAISCPLTVGDSLC